MKPVPEDALDVATLGGLTPRRTRPYGSPPYHVPLWGDDRARDFAEELLASADVPVELMQLALHVMRTTPPPRSLNNSARQVLPGTGLRQPVVSDIASRRVTSEIDGPEIRDTIRELSLAPERTADDVIGEGSCAVIVAFLALDQDARRQVLQTLNHIEDIDSATPPEPRSTRAE